MTESEGCRPQEIADLWRERFGEPPPILTDAETMLRVLISSPPRSFAPPDERGGPVEQFHRRLRIGLEEPWDMGGEDTTP